MDGEVLKEKQQYREVNYEVLCQYLDLTFLQLLESCAEKPVLNQVCYK